MCNECITPCCWICFSCVLHEDNVDEKNLGKINYWFDERGVLSESKAVIQAVQLGKACPGCQSGREDVDWLPSCQFHKSPKSAREHSVVLETRSPL